MRKDFLLFLSFLVDAGYIIAGALVPPQKSDSRKDGKGAKANDSNKDNV